MITSGAIVNLVLGACAIGYSFMPADRVRGYRRSVALLMRWVGVVLVALAVINLCMQGIVRHHGGGV